LDVVSGEKMCWRLLEKLERDPSAISLLQRVNKAAVTIIEILVNNFDLTLQLNVLAWVALQLSGGCLGIAVVGGSGVVRERECAAEKNDACDNGIYYEDLSAEDPGADL